MATEVGSAAVNGYSHNTYGGPDYGQQSSAASATGYGTAPVGGAPQAQSDVSKEEVAWYFVESYYTAMSKTPEKLHLFFNKRSQFVFGLEEEKSPVAHGLKAIKDRVTELDFQDCKVRVTNVDAQASDSNIVIQVLGGISNKQQPHRKFAQTFVLAAQTNGYFVLNDIFRYIKEDEEETPESAQVEDSTNAAGVHEPAPSAVELVAEPADNEVIAGDEDVQEVDKKLEEFAEKEEPPTAVLAINGTPATKSVEVAHDEDTPADPKPEPEESTAPTETAADFEPEKPKDPVPTPAPAAAQPVAPPAPPKPTVPKTWAQLASANRASPAAATSAASAAAPVAAPPASKPAPVAAAPSPAPPAASAVQAQAREVSPDSNKDGSSGGWQTAGGNERKQSRVQNAPAVGSDGKVRAYVKYVGANVDGEKLKQVLGKFGEVVYFDVARGKNAAFVEYKTLAGFQAAVAANPIRIGSDEMYIEERRVPGAGFSRGGGRGGRGGSFDSRSQGGRGDFKGTGAPRGGYTGRGRGNGTTSSRGGRGGGAQAA